MQAKPIVIVKTGDPVPSVLERRGGFADLIQEALRGVWTGSYRCVDAQAGPHWGQEEASAFILTGSPANVPNREPWMLRTEQWLRDVTETSIPVFGICFGHQLLAQALGGEVQKNPRGREIGTVTIDLRASGDPFLGELPVRFEVNATHVDTVLSLPKGAACLASSALDDNQIVRFSPTCYGVQYHPEMDADVIQSYVRARTPALLAEGFDVERVFAGATDAPWGRRTLQRFVTNIVLGK